MSGNAAAVLDRPAFRKIDWLQRDIAVERRDDAVPRAARSAESVQQDDALRHLRIL